MGPQADVSCYRNARPHGRGITVNERGDISKTYLFSYQNSGLQALTTVNFGTLETVNRRQPEFLLVARSGHSSLSD